MGRTDPSRATIGGGCQPLAISLGFNTTLKDHTDQTQVTPESAQLQQNRGTRHRPSTRSHFRRLPSLQARSFPSPGSWGVRLDSCPRGLGPCPSLRHGRRALDRRRWQEEEAARAAAGPATIPERPEERAHRAAPRDGDVRWLARYVLSMGLITWPTDPLFHLPANRWLQDSRSS